MNKQLVLGDIENAVAARFGLTRAQMQSLTRARAVARPRQIAMFLAREMTGHSLPRIGTHFARDHTTVLHAVRRIRRLAAADPVIAAQVEGCRELLARTREGEVP
ncbi:MAG: helix-turn-helix domain-containing protein [Rhizomicrobium sp.]